LKDVVGSRRVDRSEEDLRKEQSDVRISKGVDGDSAKGMKPNT